jgi:hypothetical protein
MPSRLAVCALLIAGAALAPARGQVPSSWPVRLVDRAAELGLTHPVIYGDPDRKRFIVETNGCGVGLVDLDADGWVDALVLNGTRLEPGARALRRWSTDEAPVTRLYRNVKGRFVDVTAGSGLDRVGLASSACAGDYDGDGRIDLFITYFGRNVLFRNRGGGRFEEATAAAGLSTDRDRWGSGCSFLDADRDGDLDLFVANYLRFDLERAPEPGQGPNCHWKGVPVNCGPKGLSTDTNLFYRNHGNGTFTDVSDASGISKVTGRYSMTAAAADLDGDGWIDIYVATDSTAAILYRNNRDGTFTDVALESGSAYSSLGAPQAGMGLALGDYDADGALDVLKTHFADDVPALYRGLGRGRFEDVAHEAGLAVQNRFVQWGAGMPDLDADGWMDVVAVTGHVYPEVERVLPEYPHRGPRLVFRNTGSGRFEDVTLASGPGAVERQSSRGAAFGDIDNDGDVDALVMNMNAPPSLLQNDTPRGAHWLSLSLRGVRSNRHGIGATVSVSANGRTQARAALSQTSYYSIDDLRVHVGLGRATRVDRVEVRWPSGHVDTLTDVAADRVTEIVEGSSRGANAQALPRR